MSTLGPGRDGWCPLGRGAYIVGGAPVTFSARVLGASRRPRPGDVGLHAAPRAADRASGRVPGGPSHRAAPTRPTAATTRRGAIVHRSSLIPPRARHECTAASRCTSPARTIMDLARVASGRCGCATPVAEAVRSGVVHRRLSSTSSWHGWPVGAALGPDGCVTALAARATLRPGQLRPRGAGPGRDPRRRPARTGVGGRDERRAGLDRSGRRPLPGGEGDPRARLRALARPGRRPDPRRRARRRASRLWATS